MQSSEKHSTETVLLELVNDRLEIERAEERLMDLVARFGYPEASRFALRLAFEEAISNAFQHGHRGMPPETPIDIECTAQQSRIELRVADRGPGFNPGGVPDPTLEENLVKPTGRGLLLIKAYMKSVEFNKNGNEIRMVYERPSGAA